MTVKSMTITLLVCLSITCSLYAAGDSKTCTTKYPVILAHGMLATDDMLGVVDYWWGIEAALEDEGARVFAVKLNCLDSTVNKAAEFKKQFLQILAVTGATKGNIIGHSHGTLYTRYAISNLGLSSKVATYTSLSGAHKGSYIADLILKIVPGGPTGTAEQLIGGAINWVYALILGDSNPDTVTNAYDVCGDYVTRVFNPNTPNINGVYYQSWANKIKWQDPNLILQIPWALIKQAQGDNDGLVSVESQKWGNFRGVISGASWCGGVSHMNMIGHLLGVTPGFSAPDFFVKIVGELKTKGY
jgi:triacylglycerol lipase